MKRQMRKGRRRTVYQRSVRFPASWVRCSEGSPNCFIHWLTSAASWSQCPNWRTRFSGRTPHSSGSLLRSGLSIFHS